MSTAAVLQVQNLSLDGTSGFDQEELMTPSTREGHSRHGRNKNGGSIGRARASSNANEREVQISRALNWILKRGVGEAGEANGFDIEIDEEGWADCDEVLEWQNLSALNPTLSDLQSLIESNPRQQFSLKLKDDEDLDPALASSWLIRGTQAEAKADTAQPGTLISIAADNIPESVIYGTTYATYPLILASGSLKKMGGTAIQLSISPEQAGAAEVLIYVDVRAALEAADSKLQWWLSESGSGVTVTETGSRGVESRFWKRIVGRKGDAGLLWEDGEVIKDVPIGLRGKKAAGGKGLKGRRGGEKGKGGKGKGRDAGNRIESDDGSDE